ncbi:hypothetical protein QLH32_17420 [Acinetobacter corruptisaponis]|uniref:Uncharacterized protein n=1 Tax=Acinetobacter corruptisaponis TaxID=3045147 RepID=A0ABY8S234_9GAMM|nr:hypothetical protein [Acinetobacter sp. KCTC 92772]WHP05758.1 hypothetical protein QLH32_17420 [Acinetobacter sp. KCTC 92772]
MIKQLKPVSVPDNFYCWSHPDMHLVDPRWNDGDERPYSDEEFELLQANAGVNIQIETFDPFDEISEISKIDYSDWSKWKPQPPTPAHFLIGAYDTEDGPVLWWAKEAKTDNVEN